MSAPSVSVIIPTYNQRSQVANAVKSALRETNTLPKDVAEVIVVEDHCDVARQILAPQMRDPALKYYQNAGLPGPADPRNTGVAKAKGDIVLFLDDDDELLPGHLARILEIRNHPLPPSWGFARQVIRETNDGNEIRRVSPLKNRQTGVLTNACPLRRRIPALSAGIWMERDLFVAVGGLDPLQKIDEDTDMAIRILIHGQNPWFEEEPGVLFDRRDIDENKENTLFRITNSTSSDTTAEYYFRTFQKNYSSSMHLRGAGWFLAARTMRMALRGCRQDIIADLLNKTSRKHRAMLLVYQWSRTALRAA